MEVYLLKEDWTDAQGYTNKAHIIHGGLLVLASGSGDELWKIYLGERNAEPMLENNRYYILLRYGIHELNAEVVGQLNRRYMQKLNIAFGGSSRQYVGLPFESEASRMVFSRYRYLYPVAEVYTDANPSHKQNPRY